MTMTADHVAALREMTVALDEMHKALVNGDVDGVRVAFDDLRPAMDQMADAAERELGEVSTRRRELRQAMLVGLLQSREADGLFYACLADNGDWHQSLHATSERLVKVADALAISLLKWE